MSVGPKRPPRPSRPKSCHQSDDDVGSSAEVVEPSCFTETGSEQHTSSEGDTKSQVSLNGTALDVSVIKTSPEVSAEVSVELSQCDGCVGDVSTEELSTEKDNADSEATKSDSVASPSKCVTANKPGVAARMSSTEVKFRCSPKARKAPPVPPPSKETRPSSSGGDSESEMEMQCRNISRDVSPSAKTTSSSVSPSSADAKPALKPKPTASTVRETVITGDTSASSHSASPANYHKSCASDPPSTTSSIAVVMPPIYAVVNKSRTSRSTSNVESDGSAAEKPGAKATVARSRSEVATNAAPPKKPPRTFAHSQYMHLKSLSLPRSSDPPTSATDSEAVGCGAKPVAPNSIGDAKSADGTDSSGDSGVRSWSVDGVESVTNSSDAVTDGSSGQSRTTLKDGSEKVKRRQSDKLPAPPRPPPPSFSENRSSALSNRSSVVGADTSMGDHSDRDCADGQRSARSSLSLDGKRSSARVRLGSGCDVPDSDGIYAVPSEVKCGSAGTDVPHGVTGHLACTSLAASESGRLILRPV